jgi:hypothetical protein
MREVISLNGTPPHPPLPRPLEAVTLECVDTDFVRV